MHPDLGGDPEAARWLNQAYAILSNPDERSKYDARRSKPESGPARPTQHQRPPQRQTSTPSPTFRVMWKNRGAGFNEHCLFCTTPHPFSNEAPAASICVNCECPLAAADPSVLGAGERRKLERLQLERQISYRSSTAQPMQTATTSDLSLKGLKFCSRDDLIKDQLIQIRSPFCLSLARIAHVGETSVGLEASRLRQYGVEFVTLYFPNTTGSLVSTHA